MKGMDFPLYLEHVCITRVLEVFDDEELFAKVIGYAPCGVLLHQVVKDYKDESKKKVPSK